MIESFKENEYAVFFTSKRKNSFGNTFYLNTVKLYWNDITDEWLVQTQFGEKLNLEPENIFALKTQDKHSVSCIIHFKGTKEL